MTKTRYENESHHCLKIHCPNLMSSKHHPIWYSNGLCERHFFEMDLLSKNEIDRKLNKNSKVKETQSINYQYQPLRDDIRQTREIFDGHQWQIINQKIDRESGKIHKTDIDSLENNLLKMFQLIQNYQIIQNELKD